MLLDRAAQVHQLALQAHASPNTLRSYSNVHRRFIQFVADQGEVSPSTAHLTVEMGRRWQALLRANGVSLSTVAQYTRVLKIWCQALVTDEILPANPLERLTLPRRDKHVPLVLTAAQVTLLANLCASTRHPERDRAIVLLLADTGIRNDETCNLRRDDVELAQRGRVGRVRIRRGKGGKERYQGLGSESSQAIRNYLGLERRPGDSPWLFLTAYSTQMNPDTIRALFRLLSERSGIDVHPHAMRSTYATLQSAAGMNASVLQRQLGHASLEQTQKYVNLAGSDPRDTYTSLVDRWKR